MEASESIVLGVVSGIITSAVIFVCVRIFDQVVIPWYRATIYKGLDIAGTWEQRIEHGGATDQLLITLAQRGQQITGTITVTKSMRNNPEVTTKLLIVSGTFQDGTLLLIGSSSDKKIVGHTASLLRVTRGGSHLEGTDCWLDAGNGQVQSHTADYLRKT